MIKSRAAKAELIQSVNSKMDKQEEEDVQFPFRGFLNTYMLVCLQKMYVASPYTDPVIAPDSDPQPLDAGDGLIWVVGPVLAVVFIICIVIAILLYKK